MAIYEMDPATIATVSEPVKRIANDLATAEHYLAGVIGCLGSVPCDLSLVSRTLNAAESPVRAIDYHRTHRQLGNLIKQLSDVNAEVMLVHSRLVQSAIDHGIALPNPEVKPVPVPEAGGR